MTANQAYVVDLGLPAEDWPLRFESAPYAIAAIDDAGLSLRNADLIINPNLHADASWYRDGPVLAIGPRFALLRREFEDARHRRRIIHASARKVVVSLGGTDSTGPVERILEGLAPLNVKVDVVVGPRSRRATRPPSLLSRVRTHFDPPRMVPHLFTADLAITGAGSMLYEAAACGTPVLSIALNAAQDAHARRWHDHGAVEYLGPADRFRPEEVRKEAQALLADRARRQQMSSRARSIIDGRGTDRVAAMLFRLATHSRGTRR